MSVWMLQEDFNAIGLGKGVREVCLNDAWERFRAYDGPAGQFFDETKSEKIDPAPHWFDVPASNSPEEQAFYSLKAQAEYVKAHGEAAARSMLASEGLKLGQIKKPPAKDLPKENPYAPAKPGEEAARMDRIIAFLKSAKPPQVNSMALSAGCTIDGKKLPARK